MGRFSITASVPGLIIAVLFAVSFVRGGIHVECHRAGADLGCSITLKGVGE